MAKKLAFVLALFTGLALYACGEGKETCKCTCTCGSGQETVIDEAGNEDECSTQCDATCGNDSYVTNYDCTTKG
jgi:hypothetical protein